MARFPAALVVLGLTVAIGACSGMAGSAPIGSPARPATIATPAAHSSNPGWEAPPTPPADPPVDSTISPVSLSSPTASAKQALEACGAYDRAPADVARAGLIASADQAPHYARVTLSAPQLAMNAGKPAWMVQFRGDWPDAKTGQSWIDVTCIVIDGEPGMYATGPVRDLASGKILRGYYPVADAPTKALPPVLP